VAKKSTALGPASNRSSISNAPPFDFAFIDAAKPEYDGITSLSCHDEEER